MANSNRKDCVELSHHISNLWSFIDALAIERAEALDTLDVHDLINKRTQLERLHRDIQRRYFAN